MYYFNLLVFGLFVWNICVKFKNFIYILYFWNFFKVNCEYIVIDYFSDSEIKKSVIEK